MTESAAQVRVIEESPAYWRIVFDHPPLNIVGASMFAGLQDLLARMDASPSLRVAVFESANPDFYLAHFDLADMPGSLGLIKTAGPSGLPILMDTFVRLTKSPIVSIAKIRGRVRGVGSEFVLACDMRFASRENTALAQVEVGAGVHPGGGGTDRLLDALNSFTTALTWPETQQRFQALFKRGLNRPGDMENRFAELLATFMDTQP